MTAVKNPEELPSTTSLLIYRELPSTTSLLLYSMEEMTPEVNVVTVETS